MYVIPAEGGIPKRITYDATGAELLGWTPDGASILFRSHCKQISSYVAKFSEDKSTVPGAKQIFRYGRKDLLACSHESHPDAREALLEPVILHGELVQSLPTATESQRHARESLDKLPKRLRSLFECDVPWPVETSKELQHLTDEVRLTAR